MKRIITILFVCSLGLVGCGGHSSQPTTIPKTLHWTSDGNPNISVCASTNLLNCKDHYEILDVASGIIVQLPLSSISYSTLNPADTYEIRVSGYDGKGNVLDSAYTNPL